VLFLSLLTPKELLPKGGLEGRIAKNASKGSYLLCTFEASELFSQNLAQVARKYNYILTLIKDFVVL
jgi:hypothetical protein